MMIVMFYAIDYDDWLVGWGAFLETLEIVLNLGVVKYGESRGNGFFLGSLGG